MNQLSIALTALGLLAGSAGLSAAAGICPEDKSTLDKDAALTSAATLALGSLDYLPEANAGADCISVVQLLDYADADVLLTNKLRVGGMGHGEPATLSAHVIGEKDGKPAVVRTFADFTTIGTWGSAGDITKTSLGGDDAFTANSGGTFQGYTYSDLDIYIFRDGKLIAPEGISIGGDNSGAKEDDAEVISIDGTFALDKPQSGQVTVDYAISDKGTKSNETVVFALDGNKWKVVSGKQPLELMQSIR